MIKKYLTDEEIQIVYNKFEKSIINNLNIDNVDKIITFLEKKEVYYIKDMLVDYLDLFVFPYGEFIKKFNNLCNKYGENTIYKIGDNMSMLEEMYNI